ncbi:DUF389 domain-containing protein [Maridesulfovibrio frigidus]|uniref:DUF389 domain-containing protein n=1 Tax=Maridesulfovibrio frigidus TaxID=340956 RepID=UPI00068BDB21|nr:DUF389 domain-containing protein [Maridesulfovibrio frigidus]
MIKFIKEGINYVLTSVKKFFVVSEKRRATVRDDIIQGSAPRMLYYVLMGISAILASIGLILNSSSVVIGAMLISPLMTPIFGISLGLSRGNVKLLRAALLSGIGGAVLAIGVSGLLGLLPFSFHVTPEIIARTSPTLLDLLVAAFAGLAGCLAMIDERISPVLPGIAMATALTPPLATIGLCIAFGAYAGAWGAFLLFSANFLTILAVATSIFLAAGFVTKKEIGSKWNFLRRFSLAIVGLIIVVVILTQALFHFDRDRRITKAIETEISHLLDSMAGAMFISETHKVKDGDVGIVIHVATPWPINPNRVLLLQNNLTRDVGLNATVVMRCSLTSEVSATGNARSLAATNLNGELFNLDESLDQRIIRAVEQDIREQIQNLPYVNLLRTELIRKDGEIIIKVFIDNSAPSMPGVVATVEKSMQERFGFDNMKFIMNVSKINRLSSKGKILIEKAHFNHDLSAAQQALQAEVENSVKEGFDSLGSFFAQDVDAIMDSDGKWEVVAVVIGPRTVAPDEVKTVSQLVQKQIGQEVHIKALSETRIIVGKDGYETLRSYTRKLKDADIRKLTTD